MPRHIEGSVQSLYHCYTLHHLSQIKAAHCSGHCQGSERPKLILPAPQEEPMVLKRYPLRATLARITQAHAAP